MRYCRFDAGDGPRVGILRSNELVLDVQAIDPDLVGDAPALASDPEARRRLERVVRGEPPRGTVHPVGQVRFLSPVASGRVVLVGGEQADIPSPTAIAPGGRMPAGAWSTGVGAVVRHRVKEAGSLSDHILGFTLLHRVAESVCLGPWILALDEARDPRGLGFGAFLDDEPVVRPTKALLDWEAELARANEARRLRAGDVVAVATPPMQASGEVRAALTYNGAWMGRLVAELI